MSDMWCMRGVSEEAKKAAKVGAAAQGITLGRWVEMAIMAHASWAGSPGAVADNPIAKKGSKIPVKPGDFDPAPMPVDEEILIPPGPNIEPRKLRVKLCPNCRAIVSKRTDGKFENDDGSLHVCGDAAFQ